MKKSPNGYHKIQDKLSDRLLSERAKEYAQTWGKEYAHRVALPSMSLQLFAFLEVCQEEQSPESFAEFRYVLAEAKYEAENPIRRKTPTQKLAELLGEEGEES